jgi:hypothetical protein
VSWIARKLKDRVRRAPRGPRVLACWSVLPLREVGAEVGQQDCSAGVGGLNLTKRFSSRQQAGEEPFY